MSKTLCGLKKKSKSSRPSYTIKTHIYSNMDSDKPIYLHVSPVGDLQIIQFRDLIKKNSDIAQENHYHIIIPFMKISIYAVFNRITINSS